jgi:hypothetical protein
MSFYVYQTPHPNIMNPWVLFAELGITQNIVTGLIQIVAIPVNLHSICLYFFQILVSVISFGQS